MKRTERDIITCPDRFKTQKSCSESTIDLYEFDSLLQVYQL
jgi:hypothetical protein